MPLSTKPLIYEVEQINTLTELGECPSPFLDQSDSPKNQ